MRLAVRFTAVAVAALIAAPALAQPREIALRPNAKYAHKPTRVTLPAAIGTLTRNRIAAFEAGDLDVLVSYRSPDAKEITTVYLYRNVAGDVPVWFDRAASVIAAGPGPFGSITPVVPVSPFTPPGQSTASGLRAAWAASGGAFASTALALVPVGDFYLKLRLSSATLTPVQLEARLRETLAAISFPRQLASGPAAVPVAPCGSALTFTGAARPAPKDGAAALLGALMPTLADRLAKSGKTQHRARYCRDPRAVEEGAIYRPDGDTERYLLAIQDAGRALQVGKNDLTSLLGSSAGTQPTPRYSVELVLLSENRAYGDFLTLPSPEQAMALMESGRPVSITSTMGKKNRISLNPDSLSDR